MTDYITESGAPDYNAWAGYGPAAERIYNLRGHGLVDEFRDAANTAISALIEDGTPIADAIATYDAEDVAATILAAYESLNGSGS